MAACLDYTIIVFCCPLLLVMAISMRHREKRRRTKKLKRITKHRPTPLPDNRINLSTTSFHATTSALLSLPPEIRLKIYGHVLAGKVIHLVHVPRRLGHVQCRNPSRGFWDPGRTCVSALRFEYLDTKQLKQLELDSAHFALLRTCRQVYHEAISIPYTENIFDMDNLNVLMYLRDTIRPQRFQSIKHLQLAWSFVIPPGPDRSNETDATLLEPHNNATWYTFWPLLCDMKGLVSLRLRIHMDTLDLSPEAGWIQPIFKIRGLKEFCIDVFDDIGLFEDRANVRKMEKLRRKLTRTVTAKREAEVEEKAITIPDEPW
ncbi:MAG: hypothetical protein M1824_006107 [Vezdaea acicularis]|nr:MAG: hypothetical protein M1824_006107 [Vezdaea acicularis]